MLIIIMLLCYYYYVIIISLSHLQSPGEADLFADVVAFEDADGGIADGGIE